MVFVFCFFSISQSVVAFPQKKRPKPRASAKGKCASNTHTHARARKAPRSTHHLTFTEHIRHTHSLGAHFCIIMETSAQNPLSSAQQTLDKLYQLHDSAFMLGKKVKQEKMGGLIKEIERYLTDAGFGKQLSLEVGSDGDSGCSAGSKSSPAGADDNNSPGPSTDISSSSSASSSSSSSSSSAAAAGGGGGGGAAAAGVTSAAAAVGANLAGISKQDKVLAFYIYGKALDAMEGYNEKAEKYLSKSVKLAPSDVNAWNALANCFWKKGDLVQAQECFQSALEQNENAHTLREMSILRRQLGGSNTEMVDNMVQSLKEAKRAIALDVTDKKSWYVLGNAHLAQFFQLQHDPADLSKALKAYRRAVPDALNSSRVHPSEEAAIVATDSSSQSVSNPDLFFNRATVHKYLENYDQAIDDFKAAAALDPELPAANMITYIERSCAKIQKHIETRCRIKAKRLGTISNSILSSQQHQAVLKSMKQQNHSLEEASQKENSQKENSPTSGASLQGKSSTPAIEMAVVSSLSLGKNPGKVVALKLLMPVVHETHDPPA